MRGLEKTFLVMFSVFLFASCVNTEGTSTGESYGGEEENRIVVSELSMSIVGLSAYDIVKQKRSYWLRKRGAKSIRNQTPVKVYFDDNKASGQTVPALKNVRAEDVESIQYFDANQAQMRYGLDNISGAIVVYTKHGR
jgi:hypothetical protein